MYFVCLPVLAVAYKLDCSELSVAFQWLLSGSFPMGSVEQNPFLPARFQLTFQSEEGVSLESFKYNLKFKILVREKRHSPI